jgi:hypothetical protein
MEKDRFFFDAIVEDSSQLGFDFSYQVHGVGRVGPVRILAGQSGPSRSSAIAKHHGFSFSLRSEPTRKRA